MNDHPEWSWDGKNRIWLWRHPVLTIILTIVLTLIPVIGPFLTLGLFVILALSYPGHI